MDEEIRIELERVRADHRNLLTQATRLDQRIAALELRARTETPVAPPQPAPPQPAPAQAPAPVIEQPPPLPDFARRPTWAESAAPLPVAPLASAPSGAQPAVPLAPLAPLAPTAAPKAEAPPAPVAKAADRDSLEMRIGGTWLVRAGVFMLLTFMVLAGTYLYQNVVPHLGPAAKIGLLYLAAGAMTGLGVWLERGRPAQENENLLNYARVILGGGLAAIYYVTYAAHYYPRLRVIESPLLAGAMLLAWTAFMTWLADRRNSQALAMFSVLLAYYSSAASEVVRFTLFANLALTVGAVFLLRRKRWTAFSFVCLAATYGSYSYWRYGNWFFGSPLEPLALRGSLWVEAPFLACYWMLFTIAAFLDEGRSLDSPARKATFVSGNNVAFFALVGWLVYAHDPGIFWRWPLLLGAVLLGLGEGGRRLPKPLDERTADAYLFEGISLVTLGFILYFSGWQLSLILAVESAIVLARAEREGNSRLLFWSAGLVALIAFLATIPTLAENRHSSSAWITGLSGGAILVFNAWMSQRFRDRPADAGTPARPRVNTFLASPGYFSFLGLAIWLALLEREIGNDARLSIVLALVAVGLTASIYLLRVTAIGVLAQFYLFAAYIHWLNVWGPALHTPAPPWWNPVTLLACTLALGHWWGRQKSTPGSLRPANWIPAVEALAAAAFLWMWLQPRFTLETWTAVSCGLAAAMLAYGLATRYREAAIAGQLLLFAGALAFLQVWLGAVGRPVELSEAWPMLVPIVALLLMVAAGRMFLPAAEKEGAQGRVWISCAYEAAALGLFLLWATKYIPQTQQFTVFAGAGALAFAAACLGKEARWAMWSAVPTLFGAGLFWIEYHTGQRGAWMHLAAFAILVAQQQFGRRYPAIPAAFPPEAQTTLMIITVLCGWGWVNSRLGGVAEGTFTLAAGWSIYAAVVFGLGLGLRERIYRWAGLTILACTVVHIAVIDIWQLNLLQRGLSALILGVVLLSIGFLYNRYQEKLRSWF